MGGGGWGPREQKGPEVIGGGDVVGAQPGSIEVWYLKGAEEPTRHGCDDQGQSDRPHDPVEGKGRIAIVMGVRAVTPPRGGHGQGTPRSRGYLSRLASNTSAPP